MSNEGVGGLVFLAMFLFFVGLLIGGCACNDSWEDSAKARGAMEYNTATGILEWKAELQRKDGK